VRGQLVELRASDLRFTSSEAAEFLNQVMGLDLSAEDIAALEARTEGWIAGLHLAALSIQGRADRSGLIESFTGSHRFVLDYLIEEVLEQQPTTTQTCLLQTSVLDRLTASLCEAVCSAATAGSGQTLLETLDRANLFIVPLDEERRWYRYHHLFADLLRQRLRRSYPELVPTLHHRASEWYEQNGFLEHATGHALRAKDQERATRLIDAQAEAIWLRGEHAKLQRWLDQLPDAVIFSKPQLCVFHAWYLFAGGQQEAAERMLQACEQRFEPAAAGGTEDPLPNREGRIADADRMKLRGMAAVIRAFMATYLGDVEAMALHGRQALEYLPEQELIWRSNAALALGDSQGFRGDVEAAYQSRLHAAEATAQAGDTIFSTMAYMKVA
ncbi:MAG: LuxR family transcriptional regulator, partial [Anaerolineae bacterium]|nr:LuxR family transcriptional regulator [Anaerolineae bacterium]